MTDTVTVKVEYEFNYEDIYVENKTVPAYSKIMEFLNLIKNQQPTNLMNYDYTKILLFDKIEYVYKEAESFEIFLSNSKVKIILVNFFYTFYV
jgi:hypothetical protein